jgi:uncharacterized protein (DUF934 family)
LDSLLGSWQEVGLHRDQWKNCYKKEKMIANPLLLLGMAAFLTSLLVQSGELGSIDTTLRLQTTHSFWTATPPIPPDLGIVGRHGKIYATYGIGQSLLMLPADIVVTYLNRLSIFAHFAAHDPDIRAIVGQLRHQYRYLRACGTGLFSLSPAPRIQPKRVRCRRISLFFGTAFLHYTQNLMENNFILL